MPGYVVNSEDLMKDLVYPTWEWHPTWDTASLQLSLLFVFLQSIDFLWWVFSVNLMCAEQGRWLCGSGKTMGFHVLIQTPTNVRILFQIPEILIDIVNLGHLKGYWMFWSLRLEICPPIRKLVHASVCMYMTYVYDICKYTETNEDRSLSSLTSFTLDLWYGYGSEFSLTTELRYERTQH